MGFIGQSIFLPLKRSALDRDAGGPGSEMAGPEAFTPGGTLRSSCVWASPTDPVGRGPPAGVIAQDMNGSTEVGRNGKSCGMFTVLVVHIRYWR